MDKRTDIWAFGCVLFECLTGRQAFSGETVSDTIARILQGEPDWAALPVSAPERLRGLLRRCLEKDARRRVRDIGDAKIELEDMLAVGTTRSSVGMAPPAAVSVFRGWRRELATVVIVAILTVLGTKLASRAIHIGPPDPTRRTSRFEVLEPPGSRYFEDSQVAAISPDGRMLAFVALDSAQTSRLWLRSLESLVAKPLPGTESTELAPFWSPDSRKIAFFTSSKLKTVSADGQSPAEALCDVKRARGGSWGKDGTILLAPFSNGPLYRIPAEGGELKQVTTLDSTRGETAHRFPALLPDGKHFLYCSLPSHDGKLDIYRASFDAPKGNRLLSSDNGIVCAGGYLLFTRAGKLVAQRFHGTRLAGAPVPLAESPTGTGLTGAPVVSASLHGTLLYLPARFPQTRLAWMSYQGKELQRVPLDPGPDRVAALSPDERIAVLERSEGPEQTDLWTVDLERGVATRLTYEPGNSLSPRFSPDGQQIAYAWENRSPQVIKVKSVSGGSGTQTFLGSDPLFKDLEDWSRDGRYIVYQRQDPTTRWDLWLLPMSGGQPMPYLVTPFNEQSGRISPDGRWLAYNSDESGAIEVYVQSFPTPGGKYQVTSRGGILGGWSHDGKGLIYTPRENLRRGVRVDVLPGPTFRAGPPRVIVDLPENVVGVQPSKDGARLLCSVLAGTQPPRSLTVVMNWPAALAKP